MFLFFYIIIPCIAQGSRNLRLSSREWWIFPKQHAIWYGVQNNVWLRELDARNDLFRKRFRMPYTSFQQLLGLLLPFWPKEGEGDKVRPPIEPERALSCTLLHLAHDSTYHIADTFGIGESTVRKYCHSTVEILATKLRPSLIYVPSGERLGNIISAFQTLTLFPNVCGAIDGTHIKLARKPNLENIPAQYWCRHHFHSVLLQAVCDAQRQFWDVCVVAPGGTNDAAHWKASSIYRRFKNNMILQEPITHIRGVRITPYLLADTGYGACRHLITPFKDSHPPTSGDWKDFNRHLSRGRVRIENVFGILKNRWPVLRDIGVDLERVPMYIVACCVLHNFLLENARDEPREDDIDIHLNDNNVVRNASRSERLQGQALKDAVYQEWSQRVTVLS